MKRKLIILSIIFILVPFIKVNAQSDVLDGVYVKEHVPARKPIPYHYLREADVAWSKKIWRILDLREKINFPLYYPTEPMDDRYSLIDLLINGVINDGMVVYDTDDDEFTTPITLKGIDENFGAINDTQFIPDPLTGEMNQTIIPGERHTDEVTRYIMKEVWFFDKQRSKMEVRIVGLCPIRLFMKDDVEPEQGDMQSVLTQKLIFWVYFPAARNLFADHEVFNVKNDAERRTFEDIFFKRRFKSYIYRETNVYNNRRINEYTKGLDSQLEAEKIKMNMFRIEHDLWEF